jgi:hypothetical protein
MKLEDLIGFGCLLVEFDVERYIEVEQEQLICDNHHLDDITEEFDEHASQNQYDRLERAIDHGLVDFAISSDSEDDTIYFYEEDSLVCEEEEEEEEAEYIDETPV